MKTKKLKNLPLKNKRKIKILPRILGSRLSLSPLVLTGVLSESSVINVNFLLSIILPNVRTRMNKQHREKNVILL